MDVPQWVWWTTVVVTVSVLLFDVVVIGRRPHEPSTKEVSLALGLYVGLAVAFGIGVWVLAGSRYGTEFFAGWLTEYSLSVDNLFIFLIIMARFGVPRQYQQEALLVGIVLALVMRGIFIAVGRRGDQPVQLDLLHLRVLPGLHGGQAGQGRVDQTTTTTRRTA